MRVISFTAEQFRNITSAHLKPGPGVNVICGDNGQGKTNLLEAIWLMTGLRSFRRAEYGELVMEGEEEACISAAFLSNEREQAAQLRLTQKKRLLTLNGFAVAAFANMTYPGRALAGGIALALGEGFVGSYLSPTLETPLVFGVLLVAGVVYLARSERFAGARRA